MLCNEVDMGSPLIALLMFSPVTSEDPVIARILPPGPIHATAGNDLISKFSEIAVSGNIMGNINGVLVQELILLITILTLRSVSLRFLGFTKNI